MFHLIKQQIAFSAKRPEKPRQKKRREEKNLMNIAAREAIRISSLKPLYYPESQIRTPPTNGNNQDLSGEGASGEPRAEFAATYSPLDRLKMNTGRPHLITLNSSNSNISESNSTYSASRLTRRNFRYSTNEKNCNAANPVQQFDKDNSGMLPEVLGVKLENEACPTGGDTERNRTSGFKKQTLQSPLLKDDNGRGRENKVASSAVFEKKAFNLPSVNANQTEYGFFKLRSSKYIEAKQSKPLDSTFTSTFSEMRTSSSLQASRVSLSKKHVLDMGSSEYRQRNKISSSIYISPELTNKLRRLPKLHAKCWMLYDINLEAILLSRKPRKPREIASLTKIMTCFLVLSLVKKFKVETASRLVKVSKAASLLGGTTARLQAGDRVSVKDLIYGMMLPSGNDAAYALAEYFGCLLYFNFLEEKQRRKAEGETTAGGDQSTPARELETEKSLAKDYSKHFVIEMNKLARDIGMRNTNFDSSHGLSNLMNKSTAEDLIKLCAVAVKNKEFIDIVSSKVYAGYAINKKNFRRELVWNNTNKLLDDEGNYYGIKTGITPTAGPCMATAFKNESHHFLLVILNTKNSDMRFTEAAKLMDWVTREFGKGAQV